MLKPCLWIGRTSLKTQSKIDQIKTFRNSSLQKIRRAELWPEATAHADKILPPVNSVYSVLAGLLRESETRNKDCRAGPVDVGDTEVPYSVPSVKHTYLV